MEKPELHDMPTPVADEFSRLPLGMQLRISIGAIHRAAKLVGVKDVSTVTNWIFSLSNAVDVAEYNAKMEAERSS